MQSDLSIIRNVEYLYLYYNRSSFELSNAMLRARCVAVAFDMHSLPGEVHMTLFKSEKNFSHLTT